ncbi:MAG: DUF4333 domain-containing protein [Aeromicrobium erythreum]
MRRRATAVLVLVGLLLTAACSVDVSAGRVGSMPERQVEQQVMDSLREKYGRAPDRIDCPGRLVGEVDRTMRCTLVDGDTRFGLTLTVTSVTGKRVRFDIQVDDAPLPGGTA